MESKQEERKLELASVAIAASLEQAEHACVILNTEQNHKTSEHEALLVQSTRERANM